MHQAIGHLEIGTRLAVGGAALAFANGIRRHQSRQAFMQLRVNAYAAATLRNRAAGMAARKDAERDATAHAILAAFD